MPPVLPRKRLRTPSPQPTKSQKRTASSRKAKIDVFSTLDSSSKKTPSAAENKAFLDALSDEQSSLSDADSDDFEDVLPTPAPKKQKTARQSKAKHADSDEELEFEDVAGDAPEDLVIPEISEDFQVTVRGPGEGEPARLTLKQGGKAPITKKMRITRLLAHYTHVQFLLWHNTIRNSWVNNAEIHSILLKGLPEALKTEVSKWKIAMGYEKPEGKGKGKKGAKDKHAKHKARDQTRDWGADAEKSEQNVQGDPLIRLLKYLAAFWKKRFRVTAPSLRKLGYRNPRDMRDEMDSFNDGPHDPSRHGERINDLDEFKECARECQGSRDVGAQLFTALLRGLGIEARLVASLQPTGYGWSKAEEANARKAMSAATSDAADTGSDAVASKLRRDAKLPSKKVKSGTQLQPISLDSDGSDLSSMSSSDEEGAAKSAGQSAAQSTPKRFDRDLQYPTYWTEALSPISNTHIPVSTMIPPNVITSAEHMGNFEPRGAAADKAKQVMCYVIAYSSDGTAKDVTVRYLRKRQWPGRTKAFRIPVEKIPLYNRNGKVVKYEEYDWFKRVMRSYTRPHNKRTLADDIEDQGDLIPVKPEADKKKNAIPDTLQGYKQSTEFVLERHLRREEVFLPGSKPVKQFHIGKGDKATKEPVYKRSDVVVAKTVETWHKEGRQVKVGEQALKQVPFRAVTLIRKREIEDQARDMGQKPTQGLYAEYQTEWIIPDPIGPDGVIPKNAFGNIDVYVPSMVPSGAAHIPLKGTTKVCKRLGIEFAEACTGFEFGKQRAVPVITGVVVAEENVELVIDAWREEQRAQREKEVKKREELVLGMWKKFYRAVKIRERMRKEYGATDDEGDGEDEQRWAGKGKGMFGMGRSEMDEEMEGGGFIRENDDGGGGGFLRDEDEEADLNAGGGFFLGSEDEAEPGGFEIVGGSQDPSKKRRTFGRHAEHADTLGDKPAPMSLQAIHADKMGAAENDDSEGTSRSGHVDGVSELHMQEMDGIVTRGSLPDEELSDDVKPKKGIKRKAKRASKENGENTNSRKTGEGASKPKKTRRSAKGETPTDSPYFSH